MHSHVERRLLSVVPVMSFRTARSAAGATYQPAPTTIGIHTPLHRLTHVDEPCTGMSPVIRSCATYGRGLLTAASSNFRVGVFVVGERNGGR